MEMSASPLLWVVLTLSIGIPVLFIMETVVTITLVSFGVSAFGLAARYLPVFPEERWRQGIPSTSLSNRLTPTANDHCFRL